MTTPDINVNLPTYEQALAILEELKELGVINTNVSGVKTDVATVKSNVITVNNNVNSANTNIGTPTSSSSNSTSANAHAKLNWLLSNIGTLVGRSSIINSIQSGRVDTYFGYSNITIPISYVYTSKSFVLISGEVGYETNGGIKYFSPAERLAVLTSNAITFPSVDQFRDKSALVNWQVIEFK